MEGTEEKDPMLLEAWERLTPTWVTTLAGLPPIHKSVPPSRDMGPPTLGVAGAMKELTP